MNKESLSINEDMKKLLSDDFFIPYQQACEKAFLQISLINLELSQEMDRNFVHYVKRRIKTPSSIYKKMKTNNLSLDKINDIAGIRIVVHNKKDAYSLLDKIKSDKSLKVKKVNDMIKKPQEDGYRSIHILTEVDISEKKENQIKVPCEIQIRSIAEDLWATLSHREVYKDIKLPEKLRQKMYELSNLLDGADSFAETLMELVEDEKEKGELPKIPEYLEKASKPFVDREYFTSGSLFINEPISKEAHTVARFILNRPIDWEKIGKNKNDKKKNKK